MAALDHRRFTVLMEFCDKDLEKDFFHQDMHRSLRFLKPILLVLGILNTLFLIPDYFFMSDQNRFVPVALSRIAVLLLILVLFVRVRHMKNFSLLAYWITMIEAACVMQFLFVFYQYESPNFLIQAFGVIIIILGISMVPNRSILKMAVSLYLIIGFLVVSGLFLRDIKTSEFSAGAVYLVVVFILSGLISFNNEYNKRVQFINNLELVRLSDTDYLTGAYNRAKLDQELNRWIMYSKRYSQPLSMIILDFDNFKSVNDSFGHLAGDSVIIQTVELIRSNIRKTDVLARWGGEEFVILLPGTPKKMAAELAEKFRKKIESYRFKKVNKITCSFGVTDLKSDDDMESLFQRADQMLYEAKKLGKNKVMS